VSWLRALPVVVVVAVGALAGGSAAAASAAGGTADPPVAGTSAAGVRAAAAGRAADLRCAEPTGGGEQASLSAEAAGFDPDALRRAVQLATIKAGGSVAVYRYGCRIASADSEGADRGYQSWSASKSVVSMAVARAIRLGLLSMDDTVGSLVPEADAAHGAITVRNLLQQNSGLHQNLVRDYNFILDDHLQNALTLPFDHPRGTHFTYGQVTVSLLAEVVGRAAGMDYQRFLREQLFSRIGIPGGAATIKRDRAGRTDAYMGIEMPTRYWGRLGRLLLQDGRWGGQQLLDEDWMSQVGRGTATNPCYSLLFWPDAPGCAPRWAPKDGYEINGLGEQIVWIVPSQSLVVVRFGTPTGGVKDELKEDVTAAIRRPAPVPVRNPEPETGEPSVDFENTFRTILDLRDVLAVAGVHLGPLPAAGPTRARALQLPERTLRAAPDGSVSVPVACPPVARVPCTGELDALAGGSVAPSAAGKAGSVATDEKAGTAASDRSVGSVATTAAGTTATETSTSALNGAPSLASATYRVAPGGRGTVRLASASLERALAAGGTAAAAREAGAPSGTRATGGAGAEGIGFVLRSRTTDAGGGVVAAGRVVVAPAASRLTLRTVRLASRTVRVRVSTASTVRIRVQRRKASRWVTVRRRTMRARTAGVVRGTVRTLPAGRYRVLVDARDADGGKAVARRTVTLRR